MTNFPAAIAILAGGESRRMGQDKASLVLDGATLLERIARCAIETGLPVLIVGRQTPAGWPLSEVRFVPDDRPGLGPLAGLQTALQHFPSVLALACDLPTLTPETLKWLLAQAARHNDGNLDGVAVRSGEHWEPLFSVYDARCLPRIDLALESGRRSLTRLIDEGRFVSLDAPPAVATALENVNTPEAWESLQERRSAAQTLETAR